MIRPLRKLATFFGIALLFWAASGPAGAATPRETEKSTAVQALILAAEMQGVLLRGITSAFTCAFLGQSREETGFYADLELFGAKARQLRPLIEIDRPNSKKKTKYYNKLISQYSDIKSLGDGLLEGYAKSGKVDRSLALKLRRAANRVTYRTHELLRFCAEDIDFSSLNPVQRRHYVEGMLIMKMYSNLMGAVKEAFADQLTGDDDPAVGYWHSLGEFDIHAAMYRGLVDFSLPENKTKARLFGRLLKSKHDILIKGEAMYLMVERTARPCLEEAKVLQEAVAEVEPIFQALWKETIK